MDECKPLAAGGAYSGHRGAGLQRQGGHGREVQVEPIKPTLKAPGTKRLKPKCDEPLSNFAFNFNLRRYTTEFADTTLQWSLWTLLEMLRSPVWVGASGAGGAGNLLAWDNELTAELLRAVVTKRGGRTAPTGRVCHTLTPISLNAFQSLVY